jgi:hypothetical protein
MNDELDFEIPDPIPMLPSLATAKRWKRARLEITHLFSSQEEHHSAVREFEEWWHQRALRSYAGQLAVDEVFQRHDPNGPLRGPKSIDPEQRRIDEEELTRRYHERLDYHRRRLGLPSRSNDTWMP